MMGRKTIMKKNYQNFSFMIDYVDIENIILIIKEESKKIGTIQPKIDVHSVGAEWLDLNYWL
jgi:disulfide oxidoreductase YuzD